MEVEVISSVLVFHVKIKIKKKKIYDQFRGVLNYFQKKVTLIK